MADYQHKSGAVKRKERDKRETESKKGQTSLDSFVKHPKVHKAEASSSKADPTQEPGGTIGSLEPSTLEADSIEEQIDELVASGSGSVVETPFEEIPEITLSSDIPDVGEVGVQALPSPNYDINDIGTFPREFIPQDVIIEYVKAGPSAFPPNIEDDETGRAFPYSVLSTTCQNEERRPQNFLAYSPSQKAVFCFPCRLFQHKQKSVKIISEFAKPKGGFYDQTEE